MKNFASITGELLSDMEPSKGYEWPEFISEGIFLEDCSNLPAQKRDDLLRQCAEYSNFDPDSFLKSFSNNSPVDQVIAFLNHHAFQFNSRRRFRESSTVREHVADALEAGRKIDVVIPIFCVIGNWAKRVHPTTLTFAEECTLHSLCNISKLCKDVVGVDLDFQIISDATFYIRPLGSDPVVSMLYLDSIRDYVSVQGMSSLHVHDMSRIPDGRIEEFEQRYVDAYTKLRANPGAGLDLHSQKMWLRSMASTITTRDLKCSYGDFVKTFRDHNFSTEFGQEVLRRTEKAFIDYRALKYALSSLSWDEINFPGSLRATIHQKKQDIIGLRVYPEYKNRSRLLPYHGVAVVDTEGEGENSLMRIEPEINMIFNSGYDRYVNSANFSDVYIRR